MNSLLSFALLLISVSLGSAGIYKRASNSYGDELVVPQGGGAQLSQNIAPEVSATTVQQKVYATDAVQSSGYRKKRASNSYGDEAVIPQGGGAQSYKPLVEQQAATVSQIPSSQHAEVAHSGYRRRRNAYGDEMVTPPAGGGAQLVTEAENDVSHVEQNASVTDTVHASGY